MENWVHLNPKYDMITVCMMMFYARNRHNEDLKPKVDLLTSFVEIIQSFLWLKN